MFSDWVATLKNLNLLTVNYIDSLICYALEVQEEDVNKNVLLH